MSRSAKKAIDKYIFKHEFCESAASVDKTLVRLQRESHDKEFKVLGITRAINHGVDTYTIFWSALSDKWIEAEREREALLRDQRIQLITDGMFM